MRMCLCVAARVQSFKVTCRVHFFFLHLDLGAFGQLLSHGLASTQHFLSAFSPILRVCRRTFQSCASFTFPIIVFKVIRESRQSPVFSHEAAGNAVGDNQKTVLPALVSLRVARAVGVETAVHYLLRPPCALVQGQTDSLSQHTGYTSKYSGTHTDTHSDVLKSVTR